MSSSEPDIADRVGTAPPRTATPQVVCVAGMHRSGTSLVTRLLNLLGVHLGPEEGLLPSNVGNVMGYWEQSALMEINDELLARFGGSWDVPPDFPPGWESSPALDDLRDRGRALVRRIVDGHDLWGWKDPRFCLTLPFWTELVHPQHYVICVRNPLEVAASLAHRNGFPLARGADLWLAHMAAVLAHTAGRHRLFVMYEDALRDPERQVRRMAAFIGRPRAGRDPAVLAAVRDFTHAALRNHASSPVEAIEDPESPLPAQALFTLLRAAVQRDGQGSEDPELAAVIDALARRAHLYQREHAHLQAECRRKDEALQEQAGLRMITAETLAVMTTHNSVTELQAQLAAMKEQVNRLIADKELARQHLEHRLDVERAQARAARADLEAERRRAAARLLAWDQQLAVLLAELVLAHQHRDTLEKQRRYLRARVEAFTHSPLYPLVRAMSLARQAVAPDGTRRAAAVKRLLHPWRPRAATR